MCLSVSFVGVGHQRIRVRDVTRHKIPAWAGHGCGPAFPEHNIMQVLHFRVLCYSLLTNLPDTLFREVAYEGL